MITTDLIKRNIEINLKTKPHMTKVSAKEEQGNYYKNVMLPILNGYWQTVKGLAYYDYPPAITAENIGALYFPRLFLKDRDSDLGKVFISVLKKDGDRIPDTPLHSYPIVQIKEFVKFLAKKSA